MKQNAAMLTARGYEIFQASTVAECMEAFRWHPIDLVVLDSLLPDGDGLTLCRELKEKYRVPILLLSTQGENRNVVEGLRAGADDYLSKPYDPEVLTARIEARLRSKEEASRFLCYGPLKLDLLWNQGYLEGKELILTPREFSALLVLTRNAGTVVSTQDLVRQVWHSDSEVSVRSLWTLLSRMRKKLCTEESRLEISSVRGEGYLLEQI